MSTLRDPMLDVTCGTCGKLSRGIVKRDGRVPEHWCRACSPEHCETIRTMSVLGILGRKRRSA